MTTLSPVPSGPPVLPVPEIPARAHQPVGYERMAFTAGHHFTLDSRADPGLGEAAAAPLSVIVQVTKRCDFNCGFCSETLQMADRQ